MEGGVYRCYRATCCSVSGKLFLEPVCRPEGREIRPGPTLPLPLCYPRALSDRLAHVVVPVLDLGGEFTRQSEGRRALPSTPHPSWSGVRWP